MTSYKQLQLREPVWRVLKDEAAKNHRTMSGQIEYLLSLQGVVVKEANNAD